MTGRERVLRALNHQVSDRVPIHDCIWPAAIQRWHKEGLPENMPPEDFFNYEIDDSFVPDISPRFPVKVLEQNEKFIIASTPYGGTRKNYRDYSSTPEIIDWAIKTKDDWKNVKKKLAPDITRVDWASGLAKNKESHGKGKFLLFSCGCGYGALQNYMKSEQILAAMAEDPEWIREMITATAELIIVTADLMLKNGFKFDGAFLWNDMGYKNGLLFSPETYKKTHYHADRLLFEYFRSKGMKVILHSDGNVAEIIPTLIELGLDCIQPLEAKAGMDIIALKAKFGDRIALMGGMDVQSMAGCEPAKMEEEIKNRLEAVKKNGGYIYHSDHSVPANVPFRQYCKIMELVKKHGANPEYKEEAEEGKKKEDALKTEAPEAVKKTKFKLGRKKIDSPEKMKKEVKPAASAAPAQKTKRGFMGRKSKEAGDAAQTAAIPTSQEKKTAGAEKKKFKMPFGKKK